MDDKYKLLFLDDEEYILNTIRRNLQAKHYSFFTCLSYGEAVNILKKEEIAVCFSDYRMPQIDGLSFLQKVKELSPLTTRIILTGSQDIQSVFGLVEKGDIHYFLTKPWESIALDFYIFQGILRYILKKDNQELGKIEKLQQDFFCRLRSLKIKTPYLSKKNFSLASGSWDGFLKQYLFLLKER